MTISIINQVIRAMCKEVELRESPINDWQTMSEEDLLYEAAICIFSSQSVFEVAVAMADSLRQKKMLQPTAHEKTINEIEDCFKYALSNPVSVMGKNGGQKWVKPRFKNRHASLLATTITEIYGQSLTIHDFLHSACHAQKAREILTQHIWGFGPKQASLFLRRVGYSNDLAVLDVHILDYLELACGLSMPSSKLARLSYYESIENTFRGVAAEFGHPVGCVDLAMWLTMRVAKREAFL